jgi:hypothetical protein
MAISSTACYALLGLCKPNLAGKFRNGILSLIFNGMIWTPEMFNPLLRQTKLAV